MPCANTWRSIAKKRIVAETEIPGIDLPVEELKGYAAGMLACRLDSEHK